MEMDDFDDFKIILWLVLFLLFGIVIITCKRVPDEVIMTVNGPVSPGRMGITLEHEHILMDFIGADIEQIICENPGKAFTIGIKKEYYQIS